MRRRAVFLALPLLTLSLGALLVSGRFSGRSARRLPPVPSGGLTPVELPALRYSQVDRFRAAREPIADRYPMETAEEELEKRLQLLVPFLRSPPRDETDLERRLPEPRKVFSPRARAGPPLRPARERSIHSGPGIEAFAGEPAVPREPAAAPAALETGETEEAASRRAALGMAKAMADLIRPLESLESAALKVLRLEGSPAGPARAEVLYQLAGEGSDGGRWQWNGRWELAFAPGWAIEEIRPLEATRLVMARRPFEDVSEAALDRNGSYPLQLRPGIDYFRDRLDAATGIDVYGHHGIAAGDLDGDGLEDLYLAEPPGLPNLLLRNAGDGTFEDISRGSGADLLDATSEALIVDLDQDGDEDLFLVGEGGVTVLKNDGRARFTPQPTGLEHLRSARATMVSAAAADYDLDGGLDVYVGSYVFWRGGAGRTGSRLPLPYHDARNGAPNFLLRNRGDGSFEDATLAAGLAAGNDRFTFAAAWGDYDGDGRPDLAVANDFGRKNLYHNLGNGAFAEVTEEAGVADLGAGMSVAFEDYDGDGRLDLYFGNMFSTAGLRVTSSPQFKEASPLRPDYEKHARGNTLLRNRGDGTFEDRSLPARASLGRWAWASDFLDFDLDGREDIYVANGFVTGPDTHDL